MEKLKIAVLCPSEIAFRRFMPALAKSAAFEYVGVAVANRQEWGGQHGTISDDVLAGDMKKAERFTQAYGGRIFNSYTELLSSDIDAVYIPLPPGLHYKWAKAALNANKHVLLEKPFTTSLNDTCDLITLAEQKKLALHENYMFQYHNQIDYIKNVINSGKIGDVRLYRIAFGFPFRGANDFRYNKELGGGALLDCGGYTVKLASMFLGETTEVTTSQLNKTSDFDVDIYGSGTMANHGGITAQFSFGMDNSYKCELEVWGSKGTIFADRILTAPSDYSPNVYISTADEKLTENLPADDTFLKSIENFYHCISDSNIRMENYNAISQQSALIEQILTKRKGEKL